MRSRSLSLGFLLLFGGACSQIIGLSDYDNVDPIAGGGDGQTGGATAKGGAGGAAKGGAGGAAQGGRGGTISNGGTNNAGADAGAGGVSGGEAGTSGSSGAPDGGVGAQDGVGNAGSGTGGVGGEAGEVGTTGGTSSGGMLGTGGTAGKGGSGGTAGGSGGTTGGTGTGGATCTTTDLLLDKNPNFDNSSASPPDPTPWVQDSTQVTTSGTTVVINRQAFLSNANVMAHTTGNAAWFGGVGSHYDFEDGFLDGLGEIYVLDLALTIPVGATQVTLSCYYQTQTDETTATIPNSRDVLIAWLWDYELDENAYEFQRWDASNSSPGWHLFTNTASGAAAAALAGRDLDLEFYSEVDSARVSYFFIDTCSLKVTVCN